MNRREMIYRTGAAALGLGLLPLATGCHTTGAANYAEWVPLTGGPKRKILFFTKSSGFEHSVIKTPKEGGPSFAEKILLELGPKYNFDFTFSKDGSLFNPAYLAQFDAFFFYTTGDLTKPGTDKNPPMSPEGKQAFLDAIKQGKGFVGSHSASDTCHSQPDSEDKSSRYRTFGAAADPYIHMLGGEFIKHGAQQKATMHVIDSKFPGLNRHAQDFELQEEWYSLKEFHDNLHVLLVQETATMTGNEYKRGSYPATWARMYGKGRVFYTSMGHREDVWTNPLFQDVLFGGLSWAVRNIDADVTPNLATAAPHYGDIPPLTPPPAPKKPAAAQPKT